MVMKSAQIAAKWWADQMRSGQACGDNGATDEQAVMGYAIAQRVRAANPPTERQCDLFESALCAIIIEVFEGLCPLDDYRPDFYKGPRLGLHVDYHPSEVLELAMDVAGLTQARSILLPFKTNMYVFQDHIDLGAGYRTPWRRIEAEHATREHWRPNDPTDKEQRARPLQFIDPPPRGLLLIDDPDGHHPEVDKAAAAAWYTATHLVLTRDVDAQTAADVKQIQREANKNK